MAVRTEDSQILQPVVVAITVDVVQLKRRRLTEPLGDPTSFAAPLLDPVADQPLLEFTALDDAAGIEMVCRWNTNSSSPATSTLIAGIGKSQASQPALQRIGTTLEFPAHERERLTISHPNNDFARTLTDVLPKTRHTQQSTRPCASAEIAPREQGAGGHVAPVGNPLALPVRRPLVSSERSARDVSPGQGVFTGATPGDDNRIGSGPPSAASGT